MERLTLLSTAAHRTRLVNQAFGCHWTPQEITDRFADEDIDLIIAWQEHTDRGE